MITAPPLRRRLVGGALRRYRENLGYTLEDAARILECDRSKISRIETGHRGIRPRDLRELLAGYGVLDVEQQVTLAALAGRGGARGWHEAYADALPVACQDYLSLETAASRIWVYEAQRIPVLLQTRAYARALADADPGLADDDARDRVTEAVLARQQAVLDERKPGIHVIIGEAALHQEVGGPKVMAGQLDMLAGISAASDTITLQILAFTSGAHPAAGIGSLTLLQFPGSPGLEVVHLGGALGGVYLDDPADAAAYARLYAQLRVSALSPAQSGLLLWGQKAS